MYEDNEHIVLYHVELYNKNNYQVEVSQTILKLNPQVRGNILVY